MTDRERLLEILNKPIFPHENVDPLEAVADYLLDNGVTFQKWIPVTERLPEEWGFVLGFSVDKIVGEMHWDSDEGFYWAGSDEDAEPVAVTHWMPLPEAPKEENNGSD